jgi:hypothetical protein
MPYAVWLVLGFPVVVISTFKRLTAPEQVLQHC